MSHYLLTGAGFSRNWGGWLAIEAFEYLLSTHEVDDRLRVILWEAKLRGEGFEGAFATVQANYAARPSIETKLQLKNMTDAIISLFRAMQASFDKFRYAEHKSLLNFLAGFDGIFTLNQDTLLESIYAGEVRFGERWYGSYLPYMEFITPPNPPYPFMLRDPLMPSGEFVKRQNFQPIYKLHGSHNWFSEPQGDRMLVIGDNKGVNSP